MATDTLSHTFLALADPTRRAILSRLALGESTVSDLAKPFSISPAAITKHLKILQRAGLISQGRQAQWRPCRLEAQALEDASMWVDQYRKHWEERLDRLDACLTTLSENK